MTSNSPCCTSSRRDFLHFGLAGFSALSLPGLLKKRSEAAESSGFNKHTAIILVWLPGGHSHLETYDPQPQASSNYRGPYSPIETAVPGMQLCVLLPDHACVADRFTLLRSVVHTGFCH